MTTENGTNKKLTRRDESRDIAPLLAARCTVKAG